MPMFKKIREVGSGTFGKALLVADEHGKEFVMKVIDTAMMDIQARKTAQNEAQLLAGLGPHPFIIRYYRSYIQAKKLYIIMDFAEGGDMYQKIRKQQSLAQHFEEKTIRRWFTQAALGVHYLHRKHILHRDLKTQNIFLGKDGQLLLGDFGISKVLENTLACAQTTIGTPYYLSPELCRGEAYSYPADIWALGCILYEMASLKKPFEGSNIEELIRSIKSDKIPSLPRRYTSELSDLCLSLLHQNPSKRPSISEILECDIIKKEVEPIMAAHEKSKVYNTDIIGKTRS
ncbi:NEK kinase [Cardiosporidium cionae]|uniref:non-specific serine/threonine protein kinase n=1 Tax=Cardiosporidium cionae TaxID=476202 RepID=A0ABQ7J701_9APIC|nr:NEK kinase [Cardiosporidium cionae]|eukprot:KAF8819769.1 NEK kinase [Cardiosporidium cionae]